MSLDEPLHAVSTALAGPEGGPLPVGPGRWHVLFGARQRPLLMPAVPFPVQERGLDYFITDNRLKSICAKALLKANALLPGGLLPEFRLPRVGQRAPRREFPFREPSIAVIQVGSAGPYQKASMLLMSEFGKAHTLVKIAMVRSADCRVSHEANWLRRLADMADLADRVPRLLAEGRAANGRRFLASSLAPSTATTDKFTPAHAAFLAALGRARLRPLRFEESPCLEYLEQTLAAMGPYLAQDDRSALRSALGDCSFHLSTFNGPFVIAQGDFVPWNIRVHRQRIFVFDWEYAKEGASPLADFFNYFLMQRAVASRAIGGRFLATVLRRATETAVQLYPEWKWRPRIVSALMLAYLLEVILCYSQSVNRFELGHPVIACYWRLVQGRRTWMAP